MARGWGFGLVLLWGQALVSTCAAPRYDPCTLEGKSAIMVATQKALSKSDCITAINQIDPLYNSACTDNDVRRLRASAYGCRAKMPNFFGFITDLFNNDVGASPGEGSAFWKTAAKLFYTGDGTGAADDTALDNQIESAWYASDALMAAIRPGTLISSSNKFNEDTDNPGSYDANDRIAEANFYLFLISMAQIGSLESRYGAPNTTSFKRTQVLGSTLTRPNGWEKAATIDSNGCSYASAILNLIDSMVALQAESTGKLKEVFEKILVLETLLDAACAAGCQNVPIGGGGFTVGCTVAGSACASCPATLRNRLSCKSGKTDNENNCAAAGLIRFIDTDVDFGWVLEP